MSKYFALSVDVAQATLMAGMAQVNIINNLAENINSPFKANNSERDAYAPQEIERLSLCFRGGGRMNEVKFKYEAAFMGPIADAAPSGKYSSSLMRRFRVRGSDFASLESSASVRMILALLTIFFIFLPSAASASTGAFECSGNSVWQGFFGDEISAAKACSDVAINFPEGIIESATCPNSWPYGPYSGGIYQDVCLVAWHFWANDPGNPHWEERVYGVYVNSCGQTSGATFNSSGQCVLYGDRFYGKPKDEICIPCQLNNSGIDSNPPFGNPIYPLTGSRRQDVDLGLSVGGQPVKLTYDTAENTPEVNGGSTWLVPSPPSFGTLWQSNMHRRMVLQSSAGAGAAYSSVALIRGSATFETAAVAGFDGCAGNGGGGATAYQPIVNANTQVQLTGTGVAGNLVDGSRLTEEIYDATGEIQTLSQAAGGKLSFVYTSGLLTGVSDSYGRLIQFAYEQPAGVGLQRINLITATDGSTIKVGYDANDNLQTLTWSDSNVQTFAYENPAFPWALTGVIDEAGGRYSTYGYDPQGRANSTFLGNGVNQYTVTYSQAPQWSVTETMVGNVLCREHRWQPPTGTQVKLPNLQVRNISASAINGMVAAVQQDQVAGSGSPAASNALAYDGNGNIASYDDFNGGRACFLYDLTRNLPTVTLEGLAGGAAGKACPTSLASYTPNAVDAAHPERKTTTVWHPDWVLKAQEAAPKKITMWVYNGQPDPIAGGTAACVTPATTLPDGKPLAVLCARYEQATTDTTGALGLSATVSGATRAWTYTYNQYGQVLTETTPKQSAADTLSHTTTYTYYATTSFTGALGYTMGDLQTLTNPLGQVTQYTAYDKAGRLLSSTDPNGTVTSMTYTPRGWLQSQTVTPASGAALTTTYAYWPTGLLETVTMPDASTLNYSYDPAHRLTDVVDGAGNKVHYVLDNVGNRTSEQVSDASGNLAASVARVFDALNRVQTQTGVAH